MQQQQLQMQAQLEQQKQQLEYQMHKEDLEAKILIAQINGQAEKERMEIINHEDGLTKVQQLDLEHKKVDEQARQFNAKLEFDKQKQKDTVRLEEKKINKSTTKK